MAEKTTADQPQRPAGPPNAGTPEGERDRQMHNARDVRQGEIILKKPWQKIVFGAGLVGIVLLIVLSGVFGWN